MLKFLIDEDGSRSTARLLSQEGFDSQDVRDVGLRGHSDHDVLEYAKAHHQVLITCDKGFANTLIYPLGSHTGIIVIRIPDELPLSQFHQEVIASTHSIKDQELSGALVIIQIGRIRIRRP
jgi:predicted nuclease of predicted toxin-antitoxin system